MRLFSAVVLANFCMLLAAATPNDNPKPKVSKKPLTADQVAIYRAVLRDYIKDSEGVLNVADQTEPFDRSKWPFARECFSSIAPELLDNSPLVVHRLGPAVALKLNVVLVNADRQEAKIKQSDPQNLVERATDDGESISDQEIEDSVKQAFKNGLFILSEIVFDRQHLRAVVSYSFVCGRLCGHGDTLLLEKVGHRWLVSKRCGMWVS